jgi:nucleoside-diphosphate-sugar epimerase
MNKILVTGACGQIGTELTLALRERYGDSTVVALDRKPPSCPEFAAPGPFELVDVTDRDSLAEVVDRHEIGAIYHLAAILSAAGEQEPLLCWEVNVNGLRNVLEVARSQGVARLFYPSSIAVFGASTPCQATPQETVLSPSTMYGVTKATGEFLCNYYGERFALDIRGVRYPGLVSSEALPGGGTTDYAVAFFYEAIAHKRYTCFVREDTVLPMMYMPDAVRAAIQLMEFEPAKLRRHADYNLAAMSFSAGELAEEIRKHIPEFDVTYAPDFRQAIADSWPHSIDDSAARAEWGWRPQYDLAAMTADMLNRLGERNAEGKLYR